MDESENEGEDEREQQHLDVEEEEEEEEAGAQWKKEVEAIQRAMDEENSRVESAQSRQTSKDDEDERKASRGKSVSPSTSAQNIPRTFELLCCSVTSVWKEPASSPSPRELHRLRGCQTARSQPESHRKTEVGGLSVSVGG